MRHTHYVTLEANCPICDKEIEYRAEVEPPDHYGADADGNRGIWVSAYVITPDADEQTCPEGCKWSDVDRKTLQKSLENLANDYDLSP